MKLDILFNNEHYPFDEQSIFMDTYDIFSNVISYEELVKVDDLKRKVMIIYNSTRTMCSLKHSGDIPDSKITVTGYGKKENGKKLAIWKLEIRQQLFVDRRIEYNCIDAITKQESGWKR